jgi:hypothetical protein
MKINIFSYEAYTKKKLLNYLQIHTDRSISSNPVYAEKLTNKAFIEKFIATKDAEQQAKMVEEAYGGLVPFEFTEDELYELLTITNEELKQFFYE